MENSWDTWENTFSIRHEEQRQDSDSLWKVQIWDKKVEKECAECVQATGWTLKTLKRSSEAINWAYTDWLTLETTPGIAYIVLAYTLFVFQCVMEQKGVQEREKREQVVLNAIHAASTPPWSIEQQASQQKKFIYFLSQTQQMVLAQIRIWARNSGLKRSFVRPASTMLNFKII